MESTATETETGIPLKDLMTLGKIIGQEVVMRLHRYPVAYTPPASIADGLADAQTEELTAADWYRRRSAMAREQGDEITAQLYDDIANDEENDHYVRFGKRRMQVMGVD